MNVFKTSLVKVVLATTLIAGGAIAPAHAVDNRTFDVTITIKNSCHVKSTEDVVFGTRQAIGGKVDATGSVSVQCTKGAVYDVALDEGVNSTDGVARQMKHATGTDTIAYQLFQDSAYANVWGQTDDVDTVGGTGTGFGDVSFDRQHVIYAQATIIGDEPAGTYSDVVIATVTL